MAAKLRASLEEKPAKEDCWTFRRAIVDFAGWVNDHNAEHVKRTEQLAAAEIRAGDATPIRRVDPRLLALILLRRGVKRKVQNEGIEFWGYFYQAAFLNKIVGSEVEIGWKDQLDRIAVFRTHPERRAGEGDEYSGADFLGWAKVEGTLRHVEMMGLVASRNRQVATVVDAEARGEELRTADLAAARENEEPIALPLAKQGKRSDPMTRRRGAAHDRMMARAVGARDAVAAAGTDGKAPDAA